MNAQEKLRSIRSRLHSLESELRDLANENNLDVWVNLDGDGCLSQFSLLLSDDNDSNDDSNDDNSDDDNDSDYSFDSKRATNALTCYLALVALILGLIVLVGLILAFMPYIREVFNIIVLDDFKGTGAFYEDSDIAYYLYGVRDNIECWFSAIKDIVV